ncbi:outer membrane protein assembly factor [Flavobacteriaceae bacterium R38]|nr:outer membrane protein assembly factor [Flavobacteriaceae bacterium R38]
MIKQLSCVFLFLLAIVGTAQDKIVFDVKIRGTKKTKVSFVKKIIKVKNGAVLDSVKMDEDIAKLKRLAGISHAYYQVFHAKDNFYDVYYNIEESFTIIPEVNLFTARDQNVAYRLALYDFNFLGRNIGFGGFFENNVFNSFGLNLFAPYLFTNKIGIALNYDNIVRREPLFTSAGTANYRYSNRGIEALLLYEFDFKNNIQIGGSVFNEEYLFLDGVKSDVTPEFLDLEKWQFKFIYTFNNLDYDYQYVSGIRNSLDTRIVTSNNEFQEDFFLIRNRFDYFKRVGKLGNWANRIQLGIASNDDSPFAPFEVDNNVNIRGVGNIIDRGTAMLVLNTEYRHTLVDKGWFVMQSNIFLDAGTWRNPGGELGDFFDIINTRIYPGVGLRFIHKKIFNAVFRVDYGYGLTQGNNNGIVFGIGQYF